MTDITKNLVQKMTPTMRKASSTAQKDLRTQALVLRRTNYGETDRIISLLTPSGKIDVLAKGARKEKSRLAGGIEMFCLSEVVVHQHRPGQGRDAGLATLTAAKMVKFYQNILTDLSRLELASSTLKGVAKLADQISDAGPFELLRQVFEALHEGMNATLVETFYLFNLAKISGEEMNLYFDTRGEKLRADGVYTWNTYESALEPMENGQIGVNEIKLMRLIVSAPPATVSKIQQLSESLPVLLNIARSINQL